MNDIVALHGDQLRALTGHAIGWSRAVCVGTNGCDALHGASPVVLGVAGRALELWSIYVSEFAFSWDTLDFTRAPFYWIGRPDEDSRWAVNPLPALELARDRVVERIRLMEWGDLCGGIEFALSGGLLVVCNPGDSLLVTDETPRWDGGWVSL